MDLSNDGFLGGRVVAQQPRVGFRSGTDAVMLAAAVPGKPGDEVLELGCGAGIASLCFVSRITDCHVTGVELAPELVAIAEKNARANGWEARVDFEVANVLRLPNHLRKSFDHVFCNPPFHRSSGEISPNADRARALSDRDGLHNWIIAGLARVAPGGTLTLIVRADRLGEVLRSVPQEASTIFPLWPRQGEPAKRVILQIVKDSRAQLRLSAGLVLHEHDGRYTPQADRILRGGGSLAL
jgi:tRNA1Val (adenine37-N6)-methyltransferase